MGPELESKQMSARVKPDSRVHVTAKAAGILCLFHRISKTKHFGNIDNRNGTVPSHLSGCGLQTHLPTRLITDRRRRDISPASEGCPAPPPEPAESAASHSARSGRSAKPRCFPWPLTARLPTVRAAGFNWSEFDNSNFRTNRSTSDRPSWGTRLLLPLCSCERFPHTGPSAQPW